MSTDDKQVAREIRRNSSGDRAAQSPGKDAGS